MLAALALWVSSPKLDAILDVPELKGALYSATVTDLDGKVLYERNADQRVMPASNMKLIANSFALYALGKDYVPVTRFWKEKNRVVVDSSGDPGLTYQQLNDIKKTLNLTGKLPVYVRQSYRVGIPEGWEYDDLPNRYAAPVTSFSFDQAAFELWAERGKAFLLPESFGVKIAFDPKLKDGASQYDPIRKRIRVGAKLPAKRTRLDTLALPNGDESAALVLGSRMYSTDKVPERVPNAVIVGKPLPELMKTCLVRSDNIMAENLFLMAAAKEGDLGDHPYDKARERAFNFLTKVVGIEPQDLRIQDGSGLSRHNLVTARGIANLLSWADKQPTAELWKSCLVSPLNGTLKGRLKDVDFRGKTGTLDMVVSLSGYIRTKSGDERIMSLLLNHFTSSSVKAREIVDNFAKTVYEGMDGTASAFPFNHESREARPFESHLFTAGNWINRSDRNRGVARSGTNR
ncbi:MAG TPA: D-alanyl-D-alanine carboxypeptidase [Fimbriimonadaceae bacterium]|nr:D-alanyl-D-alanine carboxypeptidase [Fimbriimonadaceae bacterium]